MYSTPGRRLQLRAATAIYLSLTLGLVCAAAAVGAPSRVDDAVVPATQASTLHAIGFDGDQVTVAIIDTGVEPVRGLDRRLVHQENLSAAPDDGDQYGHGTFVAGLVHRMAPKANIVSVKVSGADGAVDVSHVLAALQWVVTNRDRFSIDVLNLSFGTNSLQPWQQSPLNFAVQQAWDSGIVVVTSAGNVERPGDTITKPGDDPLVITVGSSDHRSTARTRDDVVAPFSASGPTAQGVRKLELVAPGTRIVSLRAPGSTIDTMHPGARVGTDLFRGSGTSFSAPLVSGAAALLLDAVPGLSPDQVKHALMAGAVRIEGNPDAQGEGTPRLVASGVVARRGLRAQQRVRRSTGRGSLQRDRGTARLEVTSDGMAAAALSGETTALVSKDEAGAVPFDSTEYVEGDDWDASRWGATQWDASRWGASRWGAVAWGDDTQWGAAQWWASRWG